MDKEALSHYGWVIIVIIIVLMFITAATPMGSYIFDSFMQAQEPVVNSISSENVFVSGACMVNYTAAELESFGNKVYQIGLTKPEYVLAIFNKDNTSAVVVKNGAESDGKVKNFNARNSPFYVHRQTLKEVEVREGITNIGLYMFYGCGNLKDVLIPISVESINNFAFCDSKSMKSIYIPKNVKYISGSAFTLKDTLVRIDASAQNKHYIAINNVLFSKDMTQLVFVATGLKYKTFEVPQSVKSIGSYALYNMKTLEDIIIPEGVTQIGHYAFGYCIKLKDLIIPSTVNRIENYAFYGCKSLTSVAIPEGVKEIRDNTFNGCSSLASITIPSTVEEIDSTAFKNCPSFNTVRGKAGSFAQSWANNNGYIFEAI